MSAGGGGGGYGWGCNGRTTQVEDNWRGGREGGTGHRPRDMIQWGHNCLGPWRELLDRRLFVRCCCGFNSWPTAAYGVRLLLLMLGWKTSFAAFRHGWNMRRRRRLCLCRSLAPVDTGQAGSKADCGLMNWGSWCLIARSNERTVQHQSYRCSSPACCLWSLTDAIPIFFCPQFSATTSILSSPNHSLSQINDAEWQLSATSCRVQFVLFYYSQLRYNAVAITAVAIIGQWSFEKIHILSFNTVLILYFLFVNIVARYTFTVMFIVKLYSYWLGTYVVWKMQFRTTL